MWYYCGSNGTRSEQHPLLCVGAQYVGPLIFAWYMYIFQDETTRKVMIVVRYPATRRRLLKWFVWMKNVVILSKLTDTLEIKPDVPFDMNFNWNAASKASKNYTVSLKMIQVHVMPRNPYNYVEIIRSSASREIVLISMFSCLFSDFDFYILSL